MANIAGNLTSSVGYGDSPTQGEPGSLEITLCGFGAQVPRDYLGMKARISETYQANSDGSYAFPVAANSLITPPGTYYTIAFKNSNGDITQVNAYQFIDDNATFDLKDCIPFDPNQGAPPPLPPLLQDLLEDVTPTGGGVGPNLVLNPGFENGSTDWGLTGPSTGTLDAASMMGAAETPLSSYATRQGNSFTILPLFTPGDWPVLQGSGFTWLPVGTENDSGAVLATTKPSSPDYQVGMTFTGLGGNFGACVFARADSSTNTFYQFAMDYEGNAVLVRYNNGTATFLIVDSYPWSAGNTHTLTLKATGAVIDAQVDGVSITGSPVTDSAPITAAGEAGFRVAGNSSVGGSNWFITGSSAGAIVDTTVAHSGSASLKMQGSNNTQTLTLESGVTYAATAWVMTNGATQGGESQGSGMYFNSAINIVSVMGGVEVTNGVMLAATAATAWTQVGMTFTVPSSGSYELVLTDCGGAGDMSPTGNIAWIDDVSVAEGSTEASTAVFDCLNYQSFELTLSGDITSSSFTGTPLDGTIYTFVFIQDGTGGHNFAWPPEVDNASSINPNPNGYTAQSFVAVGGQLYPIGPATYYP